MADPRAIVIAAPSSGSGKTLVTLGLLRALAKSGRPVSSAKAGPDYIDPRFHEAASGRPCFNLDSWAMDENHVRTLATHCAAGSELMLIEGVMGLFDGAAGGGGSTADLATLLGLPVILVVDAPRQGQSVAALVKGFAEFEADCHVAGVILNRISSATHAALLTEAIEPLGIPVLGAVPEDKDVIVPSRHLGLIQAGEHKALDDFLNHAADLMCKSVGLERLAGMARSLETMTSDAFDLPPLGQRMAIANDEAFGFAYPHMLDGWQKAGVEIFPFSPLANEAPETTADAIFLPGGYPEIHAGKLASNSNFLQGLKTAAGNGSLIYGECGGFMVLGEALTDADGKTHQMSGLLPLKTSFARRGLKLGYRKLRQSNALPWPRNLRGHEFHYSTLEWQGDAETLFEAEDSRAQVLGAMGLRRGNVMGSYAHVIAAEAGP